MKPTLTLLALLVAGVINLQAREATATETAWRNLVAIKKTEAAASPEAIVLRDQILASPSITILESVIVAEVAKAQGGGDEYQKAFRSLATSKKAGGGMARVSANVKFWDGDMSGWTDEMLLSRLDLASVLASRPNATPEFKSDVWAKLKTHNAHNCRRFFKEQRASLPKAEQIEVTRTQKALMLAIPTRDADANAWLAEISADLIALQLDQ